MPLERFIPKSPDPFIRNSQDFEVAKFGHLNTIIEYINTYVAADGLQLAGTGPLTSVARYITDSLGNTSTLAISTVNIGVGTTTPGAALEIYGGVDTLGISGPANQAKSIQIARYNNSSFQSHYIGDDGGAFFGSGLTISASGTASQLYLQVSAAGRNVNIGSAGQTLLPKDLGARLGVRGSGTTSATTALLVQNSAATQILKVQDNGEVFVNQGNQQVTFTGAGGISRIQAPNEMTIGLGASFNAMKVYYDGRVGLQNDAVFINGGNLGIGTTSPTAKLTIDSGNLLFTTTGNSEIYGLRNGVNQDTRIIINNQSTGGLHLGAKYGNPSGSIYFECGSGAYTERMRLTPNGNLLIGTTSDTARLNIVGSGSTSATTSLLVQNSSGTNLLQVVDNNSTFISNTVSINQTAPSVNAMTVQHAGAWNGTVGLFARSAIAIYAQSNLGADAGNPDGASIVAIGGAQVGYKSVGLRSNRAIISAGNAVDIVDSAKLQVDSTTQGFLPPRMTTAQRTAIVSPAAGLIVYDTTTNKSYTYDGTAWQAHY